MIRNALLCGAALAALTAMAIAQAPDTTWVRQVGASDLKSFATDIYVDEIGQVYVCGRAQPPGRDFEHLAVAKLDQWGDTLWVRYLSGNAAPPRDDIAHALAVDELGHVYVAGVLENREPADLDMAVAKFSPGGDLLWTWVSDRTAEDVAYAIAVGNNEVYAGGVADIDGAGAFSVVRLEAETGMLLWRHDTLLDPLLTRVSRPDRRQRIARFPGFYDEWEYWDNCVTALAIAPNDGRLVATGYGYHDSRDFQMWTMKYDPSGMLFWSQHHGRTTLGYDDAAFGLAVARNGDIYICGLGDGDAPGYDWLVIRLNQGGTELNRAVLNTAYNGDEWATAICLDNATPQNVYVTGFLEYAPAAGAERIVTMKYSDELVPRWGPAGAQYQTGGGNHPDVGYDVQYVQGHVHVTGRSGEGGRELVLLAYTDANASPKYEKWVKTLGLAPTPGNTYGSMVYARDTTRVFVAGHRSVGPEGEPDSTQLVAVRFSWHYRDVTPESLLAPVGRIDYGTRVVPVARVRNLGDAPSTFEVHLRIGDSPGYHDTALVGNLRPGETGFAVFDTWTAGPAETLGVLVTTALVGDSGPANDTLRGTVIVVGLQDAGVTGLVAPVGTADSGQAVTPTATVHNYGTDEAEFPVFFTIGREYSDSVRVRLGAGAGDTVRFADWTPVRLGWLEVACWTGLAGDMNPANDTLRDSVQVIPWVGVEEPAGLPAAFALESARPTQFRGGTVLEYALPRAAEVSLTVHDAVGRQVRVLAAGRHAAGRHAAGWDGRDDAGRLLGAGVYFGRFAAGEVVQLRKLVKLD